MDRRLRKSAEQNDLKGVLNALDMGASINAENSNGDTALVIASARKHPEIVQTLLELGANPEAAPGRALDYAIREGNIRIASLLVKHGANLNFMEDLECSGPPLVVSIIYNQEEIAIMLVKNGANIFWRNSCDNRTALHLADFRKMHNLTELLIKKGIEDDRDSTLIQKGKVSPELILAQKYIARYSKHYDFIELQNLKKLSILSCPESDDMHLFRALQSLEYLAMVNCLEISKKSFNHLSALTNLKELNINRVHLSDENIGIILGLPKLTTLTLDEFTISNKGLVLLKNSDQILILRLYQRK